jgi:hypothetical protein
MTLYPLSTLSAGVLLLSILRCSAIPCSLEIAQLQSRIDARLDSVAGAGPTANESVAATLHHQPTPRSIAAAEVTIGDLSPETLEVLLEDMARARRADGSRDEVACERALNDAHHAIGE